MKLNTKKGGIELHADEKRTITKAFDIVSAIEKHGDATEQEAADAAMVPLATLIARLCGKEEA